MQSGKRMDILLLQRGRVAQPLLHLALSSGTDVVPLGNVRVLSSRGVTDGNGNGAGDNGSQFSRFTRER